MSKSQNEAASSLFDSPRAIEPGSGSSLEMPDAAVAATPPRPQRVPPTSAIPVATLTCPACGFEQEPTVECAKCGLVVSKYRPREAAPMPAGTEMRSSDEIASDLADQGYEPRVPQSDESAVDDGFFGPEKKGLAKGMAGGLVMMAIAVVWFGLGWAAGYIFFYPPVLFVVGLFGFLKGMFTGNVAGSQ